MKSGIGNASLEIGSGVLVGAIAAVNAYGDVIDPASGQIVAGARAITRTPLRPGDPGFFASTLQMLRGRVATHILQFGVPQNTVIGVVATNARLNKEQVNKVAQMAQDGIAQAIRPAHTMLDGDTVFALATGGLQADVNIVGAFAAEVLAQAILRAVRAAHSAGGIPGLADL
jgi:L-aminopeptidase/D-esterase-like protein